MEELERLGYTDIARLATGGEGSLYTCEKQGRTYVAKVVSPMDAAQIDLLNRINALKSEYFPHIVDIVQSADHTIIIREYIAGTTLAEEIKKNGAYHYNRAREIIYGICSALRMLHAMKPNPVIYRDLKPDNVMITAEGDVRLIDFGIARYYQQESFRDTVPAGTRGYTAPEVMAGMQSDERSDVYSIGLVFYELLTGKSLQDPPYQIRPVAENNEFLPDYLDDIIANATDISQPNRYASIDEFVYALENSKKSKAAQKKKKRRIILFSVLGLVVILAAIAAFLLSKLKKEAVETLLALDFNEESDLCYLTGDDMQIQDGYLNLLGGWCSVDYLVESGTIVHFRIKLPPKSDDEDSYVSLSQAGQGGAYSEFQVFGSCEYAFSQEENNVVSSTQYQKFSGTPVANTGQMLDIILYTDPGSNAIYAFLYDSQTENLAYAAYRLPANVDNTRCSITIMTQLPEGTREYIVMDYFSLSEGSLKQYLKDHISAYKKHEARLEELLGQPVGQLPEMVFISASD